MRVIPPVVMTDAMLYSSSVPDLDYAAWVNTSPYSVGDKRTYSVSGFHHNYECKLAVSAGTNPAPNVDTTHWIDLGVTQRWEMFNLYTNLQSSVASPCTLVIRPGQRINGLGLVGLEADEIDVSIQVIGAPTPVFHTTYSLRDRATACWTDYVFGGFRYREATTLLGLPMVSNVQITITLTRTTGNVKCAGIVLGNAMYIGKARNGVGSDVVRYSRVDRDDFGNASLTKRKSIPKNSFSLILEDQYLNRVRQLRNELDAVPALWLGVEDNNNTYFDTLATLGVYQSWKFEIPYRGHFLCSLDIEGI